MDKCPPPNSSSHYPPPFSDACIGVFFPLSLDQPGNMEEGKGGRLFGASVLSNGCSSCRRPTYFLSDTSSHISNADLSQKHGSGVSVVCSNNCRAHLHKKGERFALPTVLSFLSGGGESSSCLSSLTVLAFSTVPPRQEGQERRAPSTQKKKRKERSSLCQRGEKRGLVFVFLFLAAFPALLASLLSSTLWGWSAAASFLSSLLGMNLAGAGGGGRGEEKKPPPRPSFLLLLLCRQVKKDVYLG